MADESTSTETSDTPAQFALWKQVVLVFLIGCVIGAYIQRSPGYLELDDQSEFTWQRNEGLGYDGYYHIKVAYLMRKGEIQAAGENFHWTRESMWNGSYSDKEWLYHAYLVPFTIIVKDDQHYTAMISAAKLGTIVGVGLFALALFFTFRLLGIRRPALWMIFATAALGTMLPTRLSEPRSWLFGVSFALLGWAITFRRNYKWLFVLAIFYTLSYTASQLLLAMIGFKGLLSLIMGSDEGSRKETLRLDAKCLGVAAAGMLVGWILHPGSFALIKIWFVQNVLVLHVFQGGEITGVVGGLGQLFMGWGDNPVFPEMDQTVFGRELYPPSSGKVVWREFFLFFGPIALPLLAAVTGYRPSRKAIILLALSVLYLVMYMGNQRLIEYAVPFGIVTAAFWLQEIFATERFNEWWDGLKVPAPKRLAIVLALLGMLGAFNFYRGAAVIGYSQMFRYSSVITWFENHPESKDKVMFNMRWSDFPELFFYESDVDYVWGLDPMFTAAQGTERSSRIVDFYYGRGQSWGGSPHSAVRMLKDEYEITYIFADHSVGAGHGKSMDSWVELGLLTVETMDLDRGYAIYRIVDEIPDPPETASTDSATTD